MDTVVAEPPAPAGPGAVPPAGPEVSPAAPAPAGRACLTCAAVLAPEQSWCLECGTASPGRLGPRPGWRTAATVVALTLLLVSGAGAASYAALSSDSRRAVSRTPVAQAPVTPTPSLPPATSTPEAPPAIATPPPVPVPHVGVAKHPLVTPVPAPVVHPATPTPSTVTPAKPHKVVAPGAQGSRVVLDTNAASVYNPNAYPSDRFGDPANAIDGDTGTVWTAAPGPDGKLQAGLDIDLKTPQAVHVLKIVSTAPGLSVEIYASTGGPPASITDPAWVRVGSRHARKNKFRIRLKTGSTRYRHVLVWLPTPSASPPGTVGIAELSLLH